MEIVCDFEQKIRGIAIDTEDNIFIANCQNNSIDKVSLNNGKISISQSTNISSPQGLAINLKNEIYIGTDSGRIMKMTKEGIFSSIAGNGKGGFADGIGKRAKIGIVTGICFDENDIAYFCDWDSDSIRKLTPEGEVSTIRGGEGRGYNDGKGEQAKFNGPSGIVYNPSTKLFYITEYYNKLIRTMTVDGNVNTLCERSCNLRTIAIDGEGKLYVSTQSNITTGEGELLTFDPKGEIKQMNIGVKYCDGIAFNSKGDLFFTSETKLCVIRNCTKYPPHPIFATTTSIQELGSMQVELLNLKRLGEVQKETQDLNKTEKQSKKRKLSEIPELESEEETKHPENDVKWLSSISYSSRYWSYRYCTSQIS